MGESCFTTWVINVSVVCLAGVDVTRLPASLHTRRQSYCFLGVVERREGSQEFFAHFIHHRGAGDACRASAPIFVTELELLRPGSVV